MRTQMLRRCSGTLTVVALTVLCLSYPSARSRGQVKEAAKPADPAAKKEKDNSSPLEVMIFPSDRDAKNMIKAVNDYLEEFKAKDDKAPWDKICFAAQQVLDAKSDSFYEAKTEVGKVQRISAKAEVNRLIGRFPVQGKQFYQLTFGGTADGLLNDAINKSYDRTVLAEVSQRYFHTKAGAQATLLLAGLHLDRGNYTEAAYSFDRLLDRKDAEELLTPLNTFKAIVAFQRAGNDPERTNKLLAQLEKKIPRDGLKIGLKSYQFDDLKDELTKSPETLFGKVGDQYVSMRLGNPSHTAVGNGGAPFLDPIFTRSMMTRTDEFAEGINWLQQNLTATVKDMKPAKGEVGLPAFFPLSSQGLAYIRTYDGIFAYVTQEGFMNHGKPAKPGDLYWIAESKGSLGNLLNGENNGDLKTRFNTYRDQFQFKSILYENPLVGSMTHDGQNIYAVDDTALPAPPMVNRNDEFGGIMPGGPGTIQALVDKNFGDGNQLIAINMLTGRLMWRLGGIPGLPTQTEEEEDKTDNPLVLTSNAFFVGPPMPVNGKLYALFEKNGRMRLACFDPAKVKAYAIPNDPRPSNLAPELVWSQRLGEPQAKLPMDSVRRFQCTYLTYADGVMICPTNAGAVVGVDIMSRSLLWARSYRSVKQTTNEEVQGRRFVRGGMGVPGGAGMATLAADRLRAAAPIVSAGRVIFSAFDAESFDCYDLRTGDLLWTHKRQSGDLYVGGVIDGKVLIVNRSSLRALELVGKPAEAGAKDRREDPIVAWSNVSIGTPAGHGTTSKGGLYYLPLADTPDGNRPEIWAINVAKGTILAKAAYRKKAAEDQPPVMLGNLAFHEGQLLSQSALELAVFPLTDLKEAEMNRLLLANPNDPVGLVARGEIKMDKGSITEAISDFKLAQKNNPPEDAQRRLREKLYSAYTELLRKDFDSGEPLLDEYKGLCEITADATDAKEKEKQLEEGFHRKKTLLEILAAGRRKQSKYDLAYDHYVEFGKLGDGKQLVSIANEPSGQVRPDVWARSQITSMIQEAKESPAKKLLEDRVAKEWTTLQNSKELKDLKQFVAAYGDHFTAGSQAQLVLAQRQLDTNSDDEIREAQVLLMKVWASATEKPVAARAVEALARLMTRRGLMDDAVALYARLGEDYADVAIRDGKTGADFSSDILADKRLLPYLEPTRFAQPARVKAERKTGGGGVNQQLTLDPEGAEGSAFYRRHRVAIQNTNSNDGSWTVILTDRVTGQEYTKFTGIKMFVNQYYAIPTHRIAEAKGQLLLVHGGPSVYCFDVAEKKKLWEFKTAEYKQERDRYYSGNPQNIQEIDTFMPLGTNTTQRLGIGRATMLESNIAVVLHKDGLTAMDPQTGTKLWTRNNVNPSSVLFGDTKHVFVVERPADGQSTRSLIFRVSDGGSVDVPADFGSSIITPAFLRFVGRNLLLSEVQGQNRLTRLHDPLTGKDVWSHTSSAKSVVFKSYHDDFTGVVTETGEIRVLNSKTGQDVGTFQVDAENVSAHTKDLEQPYLLADEERFYFMLNRKGAQNQNRNQFYLKLVEVNGSMYAFDRGTKKRLWFTDKLLENQRLLVDRFPEVPAIIAANQMQSEDGTGQWIYRAVVLDKMNGRMRFAQNLTNTNFYGLTTDPKAGTAKLLGGNVYLEISPDTAAVKK
jgi:outer membrane protein assembly factor BamB